jgi:membrane protein implicated in regulation of membrane protease activity
MPDFPEWGVPVIFVAYVLYLIIGWRRLRRQRDRDAKLHGTRQDTRYYDFQDPFL